MNKASKCRRSSVALTLCKSLTVITTLAASGNVNAAAHGRGSGGVWCSGEDADGDRKFWCAGQRNLDILALVNRANVVVGSAVGIRDAQVRLQRGLEVDCEIELEPQLEFVVGLGGECDAGGPQHRRARAR